MMLINSPMEQIYISALVTGTFWPGPPGPILGGLEIIQGIK